MKYLTPKEVRKTSKRTLLDEIKYYCYYAPIRFLDMLPRRIYWFFQRGFRGYGDNDTWDFDNYLATVISQGLKHLRKYQNGIPNFKKGKSEQQSKKEWTLILNKIILSFEIAKKRINCNITEDIWKEKYEKQYREGMNLFRDWFFALWD